MSEQPTSRDRDTPALPETRPDAGEQPDQGDNQDVAAERIYPSDPTGSDPG
jgi:hypothetical protein